MVTPWMLLLDIWAAFNVVYFLDAKFTGYQQKWYLKNTKRWERKQADFPKSAFFFPEKWWHWVLISPCATFVFLIVLVMALLVSTKEAVKTFGITFVEAWK